MDIAFHYFAVKALAVNAGFNEDDAQLIAEYSQMVDDFNEGEPKWWCDNVPDYVDQDAFDICYWKIKKHIAILQPVQTGFLADGHIINFDKDIPYSTSFQKFTCTPFHFIYLNKEEIGAKDYRVYPAVMNDKSLIWSLMKTAHDEYRAALDGATGNYDSNATFKRKALMKIGLLLHIYADTVAHQLFSGFNDNVNKVELINVTNNITGADETQKYKDMILDFLKQFQEAPMIGHMIIEHIPDLTHLSFGIKYKNEAFYTRSNTADFITYSKEIFNFLCWCHGETMNPEDKWSDIQDKLKSCFLTDISECNDEKTMVDTLKPVWTREFGGVFDFDAKKISDGYVLKTSALTNDIIMELQNVPEEYRSKVFITASEDFYLYNVCAEEVLVELYGNKPRN